MAVEESKVEVPGPGGLAAPNPMPERGVASIISISSDGEMMIYTHGQNVIVRSVSDPSRVFVYSEHTTTVNVAKFSPSGKWVASGDEGGKVRVWSWTHADKLLKVEVAALGGPVKDISWGPENKRICAVGGGHTKAKIFMFDTGSNLGEVIPLSKQANTCAMRPKRPYRCVYGGEDFELQFYSGPPFKYTKGLKEHTNFVNCVRYSPDGERFVSVSSDSQIIVYDGTTADVIGKLEGGHSGSIYGCAWSPDNARLVTSGADKKLMIWDMSSMTLARTITVGSTLQQMQNAVAWGKGGIVSVSLDGTINFFNPDGEGDAPDRVCQGHHGPITSFAFARDAGKMFTVCSGGRVSSWSVTGDDPTVFTATTLPGDMHSKKGCAMITAGGQVASASWDNTVRIADVATGDLVGIAAVGAQPRGIAVSPAAPTVRFVATRAGVKVFDGAELIVEEAMSFSPTAVAVSAAGDHVAVGGEDKKVHFYKYAGGAFTEDGVGKKDLGAAVSVLAFSPDGSLCGVGDALREVQVINTETKERANTTKWQSHTTRVTGMSWRPSGSHLVTVSTDRRIVVWDPTASAPARKIDLAHPFPFTAVDWQDEDTFWTCGTDGVLRRWAY